MTTFIVYDRRNGQVIRTLHHIGKAERFCAAANANHETTPYLVGEVVYDDRGAMRIVLPTGETVAADWLSR